MIIFLSAINPFFKVTVKGKDILQQTLVKFLFWNCSPSPWFGESRVAKGNYKSGTVNSKSFVGQVFLRSKQKFELQYSF